MKNKLQAMIDQIKVDQNTMTESSLINKYKGECTSLLNAIWDSEPLEFNECRRQLRGTMTVVEQWGVPKVQGKRSYELAEPSPVLYSTSQVLVKLLALVTAYS